MVANQQILSKGFYQYAQIGNPVLVKDYIFTQQDNKKCLLVRFSNDLEYTVDAMDFTVVQMDSTGKILANAKITYEQMEFYPGSTYVSNAGIVVDEFCTDFRIVFTTVRSGRYIYYARQGHMAVRYVRRPTEIETSDRYGSVVSAVSVKPRRFGKPGLAALLAALTVVVMLVLNVTLVGLDYYNSKLAEKEADQAETGVESVTAEFGEVKEP